MKKLIRLKNPQLIHTQERMISNPLKFSEPNHLSQIYHTNAKCSRLSDFEQINYYLEVPLPVTLTSFNNHHHFLKTKWGVFTVMKW